MTGRKLGAPTASFNIRILQEQAIQLHNLLIAVRHHNGDPSIQRSDLLRAIFARGISQLESELDQLKAAKR